MAPRLRVTGAPRILAQISSLLEYGTAWHRTNQLFITNRWVQGFELLQRVASAKLCLLRQFYASSRTSRSGINSSSRTMAMVMNSTPQGLWLGRILERNLKILDKQTRHHLQSGMTRQVSTLNVLASSQQPKLSRQTTALHLQVNHQ